MPFEAFDFFFPHLAIIQIACDDLVGMEDEVIATLIR